MADLLLQLLSLAYASVGIVSAIAYYPTIKDLFKKKPSANVNSYLLWTITSTIAFLYSLIILDDLLFRFVSAVNFFACLLILILSLRIKAS